MRTFRFRFFALMCALALVVAFATVQWRILHGLHSEAGSGYSNNQEPATASTTPVPLPIDKDRISEQVAIAQKKVAEDEAREARKVAYMKSIGMEDEGIYRINVEISAIAGTLAEYGEVYHEFPQGSNREVATALLGRDGKKRMPFLKETLI